MLYQKWWRNTGTCTTEDKKGESKANELGIANVGGIFVVLFVGLALAIVVAIVEFVIYSNKNAKTDKVRVYDAFGSTYIERIGSNYGIVHT